MKEILAQIMNEVHEDPEMWDGDVINDYGLEFIANALKEAQGADDVPEPESVEMSSHRGSNRKRFRPTSRQNQQRDSPSPRRRTPSRPGNGKGTSRPSRNGSGQNRNGRRRDTESTDTVLDVFARSLSQQAGYRGSERKAKRDVTRFHQAMVNYELALADGDPDAIEAQDASVEYQVPDEASLMYGCIKCNINRASLQIAANDTIRRFPQKHWDDMDRRAKKSRINLSMIGGQVHAGIINVLVASGDIDRDAIAESFRLSRARIEEAEQRRKETYRRLRNRNGDNVFESRRRPRKRANGKSYQQKRGA